MSHGHMLARFIGLLCLNMTDFEPISGFREDPYFAAASGVWGRCPRGILRQRMGTHAWGYPAAVETAAMHPLTPLALALARCAPETHQPGDAPRDDPERDERFREALHDGQLQHLDPTAWFQDQ
jgi:hypothetical protein